MFLETFNEGSSLLPGSCHCRLVYAGNVTDVTVMQYWPSAPEITRLNKDEYMDNNTGEVKFFEHKDLRLGNKRELIRTYAKLRAVINANCIDPQCVRMLTYTYRENMTDLKKLYTDFHAYWKRQKREYNKTGVPIPEYIAVAEPQGRGAWHLHCIQIWKEHAPPYIDYRRTGELWGHGWVDQRLGTGCQSCDNLGAYFSAYFGNLAVDEYADLPLRDQMLNKPCPVREYTYEVDGKKVTKTMIKGGRLCLYPTGMNIFRCSRGICKPEIEDCFYWRLKEKVGAATPTFSHGREITNLKGEKVNYVLKQSYNSRRPDGMISTQTM